MDCENSTSNTLTDVPIENGWWRASRYSDEIYRCQYSGACKDGECAEGHKGVACRVRSGVVRPFSSFRDQWHL